MPAVGQTTSPATTRPASGGDGADVVRELAGRPMLLSTTDESVSKRFSFQFAVSVPDAGRKPTRILAATIGRDGDRGAIIYRHGDGLPFAYVSSDLVVCFDASAGGGAGEFLTCIGGGPGFYLVGDGGRMDWVIGAGSDRAHSRITFDPQSLLLLVSDVPARLDGNNRVLKLEGQGVSQTFGLASPSAVFPISSWSLTKEGSVTLSVSDISVGGPVPDVLFGFTADRLAKLPAPTHPTEIHELAARIQSAMSERVSDERSLGLMRQFQQLLESGSTRPATRP